MKMLLTLTARHGEGENLESFQFQPERPFTFEAGQYLRYTLNHPEPDNRGVSPCLGGGIRKTLPNR
jgi:ferredoxin-NADP reductase